MWQALTSLLHKDQKPSDALIAERIAIVEMRDVSWKDVLYRHMGDRIRQMLNPTGLFYGWDATHREGRSQEALDAFNTGLREGKLIRNPKEIERRDGVTTYAVTIPERSIALFIDTYRGDNVGEARVSLSGAYPQIKSPEDFETYARFRRHHFSYGRLAAINAYCSEVLGKPLESGDVGPKGSLHGKEHEGFNIWKHLVDLKDATGSPVGLVEEVSSEEMPEKGKGHRRYRFKLVPTQ